MPDPISKEQVDQCLNKWQKIQIKCLRHDGQIGLKEFGDFLKDFDVLKNFNLTQPCLLFSAFIDTMICFMHTLYGIQVLIPKD